MMFYGPQKEDCAKEKMANNMLVYAMLQISK